MHAQEVLRILTNAGFQVDPIPEKPDKVRVTPLTGRPLSDEQRNLIRANKPALLSLLTRRPVPVPNITPPEKGDIR